VSAVATLAGLHASELILLLAILLAIGLLIWALFPRVGILSLELATSAARAKAIVGARSRDGRLGAMRLNVYLDFPFLVVYSTMLAVAVVLAGRAATSSELISKEDDQVVAAFVLGALTAGVVRRDRERRLARDVEHGRPHHGPPREGGDRIRCPQARTRCRHRRMDPQHPGG
jgi:hypothetical protein